MASTHTFHLFILVVLLFSLLVQSNVFEPQKKLFILAGQSNMSGRGGLNPNATFWDGFIPLDNSPDPTNVFRFNVNRSWVVASDPLHGDIEYPKVCGVGPGMAFANAIKNLVGSPIGLIPCAIGGTSISDWARGQKAYDNMVERVQAATFSGGEVYALLWFQGESDTVNSDHVACYRTRLEQFIQNLRTDLDLPSLPVIQVAIESGSGPFVEQIRSIQKTVGLENVVWVDSANLTLNPDHLHLTTMSQVVLGYRLAVSYYNNFLI